MKIKIRKAKVGDEKGIAELFKKSLKEGFYLYTGSDEVFDKKKIASMKKDFSKKEKNKCSYVAINEKGKLVGSCVYFGKEKGRLRHRVELGWGVSSDYNRKGIATKMVKQLIKAARRKGIKKIRAEICVKNKASMRLAEKLGMKKEGKIKKGMILDNGKFGDTIIFGKFLK